MTARDRADKNANYSFTENYSGKLAIKIYESRAIMGSAAAAMVAEKIKLLLAEQDLSILFSLRRLRKMNSLAL